MGLCSFSGLVARRLTFLLQRCSVVYMAIMRRSHPGANCVWLSICRQCHSVCMPENLAAAHSAKTHFVRVRAYTVVVAAQWERTCM
jgi:hypothetical protein